MQLRRRAPCQISAALLPAATPAATAPAARCSRDGRPSVVPSMVELRAACVDARNTRADGRVVEDLGGSRAALCVLLEHLHHEELQLARVVAREGRGRRRHYLACERELVGGEEGRLQRAQLVHEAAECPHVRLGVVRALLAHLGREIERRAHTSACMR